MMVEWLFLLVPWGCLRFVIVVFPDHNKLTIFVMSENISCFRRTPQCDSDRIIEHERVFRPNALLNKC